MKRFKINKIIQILFVLLFFFGVFAVYLGCNNNKKVQFKYDEKSDITYKVYLKPNQFFDTPYLEENKTYIASLIDYVDVGFDYSSNFSNNLNGEVKYKYVVLVSADKKESSGYYWQKEYDLSDFKTVKLDNNNQVAFSDHVKLKYDTYNNILNKFKKEYSLVTDGVAKVMLKIENKSDIVGINEPVNISSISSLSIPLLEKSLEISMNKDATNNSKTITFDEVDESIPYTIYKALGVIMMILSIIGFINVTIDRRKFKTQNEYELSLRKILDNYDSIIANIENVPPFSESKIINLSSFGELLDVYNEVRMPINYYQNPNRDKSTFLIINDNIVWIYSLKKES